VVVLSPAAAVIVKDLGKAELVVGRHGFDQVLDASLPVCEDLSGVDYERVIGTAPTHVITEWGVRGMPERFRTMANASDWRLHDCTLKTLADIRFAVGEIGRFVSADPERIRTIQWQMDEAWRPREVSFRRVALGPVLMLAELAPPAALGPGCCHHEILVNLGAVPAIKDGGPYQTLTLEQIVAMKPGVILLMIPRNAGTPSLGANASAVRAALGKIAEISTPALKEGRVALIDDPLVQMPSTSMITLALELEKQLRAWEGE
jgi:ABC-type hemin transport system substrate-binding protein